MKKKKDIKDAKEEGKKLYISTCQRCHGTKGEIEASNTSKALNKMTLEEMEVSIREYTIDNKDNGMAILMNPYSDSLSDDDLYNIDQYLKTVN